MRERSEPLKERTGEQRQKWFQGCGKRSREESKELRPDRRK